MWPVNDIPSLSFGWVALSLGWTNGLNIARNMCGVKIGAAFVVLKKKEFHKSIIVYLHEKIAANSLSLNAFIRFFYHYRINCVFGV